MTPRHLKNNMTPTTKCCCWLAPSKVVRFGEGGETDKGGWVEMSQGVRPDNQHESSLRNLYKLGRGKHERDKSPFHLASLKTRHGLPLMAEGVLDIIFTPPFSWDILTFVGFTQRRAAFLAENPFPFLIIAITQTVHLAGCDNFLTGFI